MTLEHAKAMIEANSWVPRTIEHRDAWNSLFLEAVAIASAAIDKAEAAAKESAPLEGVIVEDDEEQGIA